MALPTQDLGPPPEPKDPRFLQWLALLWAYVKAGSTGTTGVAQGGTGLSSVAQGDILYGSATDTYSLLNKNTTATRYLSNTGTSNNPAWAQVALATGVSGTLPVANGGTSLTTLTANALYVGNGTSVPIAITVGTNNQFLKGSTGAAPAFGTATLASADFANQGTTTTVLHGNAAGNPSFAAVSLTADVSGTLPIANIDPGVFGFAARHG